MYELQWRKKLIKLYYLCLYRLVWHRQKKGRGQCDWLKKFCRSHPESSMKEGYRREICSYKEGHEASSCRKESRKVRREMLTKVNQCCSFDYGKHPVIWLTNIICSICTISLKWLSINLVNTQYFICPVALALSTES